MLTLRKKALTPAQELQRQAEIAAGYEAARFERDHAARVEHAKLMRERSQKFVDDRQRYQDAMLEDEQARAAEREAQRAKLAAAAAEHSRQLMARLKAAEQARANVEQAIRQHLEAGGPTDLGSPEAAVSAAERAARLTALRDLLAAADVDLRAAERACGRHRW